MMKPDGPERLLAAAVRLAPKQRREWGIAMLAELAQLQNPSTRWHFALACAGVALFPPRQDGLLQTAMNNQAKSIITHPGIVALIGLLFITPFLLLNVIVANRIEPFFALIRPDVQTSPLEYVLLSVALLFLPAGAFIAVQPMLRAGDDGKRKLHLVNGVLAALLIAVFILLTVELGSEIYRCDILLLPNCD